VGDDRVFEIGCWNCSSNFNAYEASFCTHKEPTKICPFCLSCSCEAPEDYKRELFVHSPADILEERAQARLGREDLKLGEILLNEGKIVRYQLDMAIAKQRISKKRMGETLVDMGLISRYDLMMILANQRTIAFIDLTDFILDVDTVALVGQGFCLKNRLVPLELYRGPRVNILRFALAHKDNLGPIKEHFRGHGALKDCLLIPYLAPPEQIERQLQRIETMDILELG